MNSQFHFFTKRPESLDNRAERIGLCEAEPSALQALTGGYLPVDGNIPICPPPKPVPGETPYPPGVIYYPG